MDREDDVPVCVACVVYAAYVLVLGCPATVVLYMAAWSRAVHRLHVDACVDGLGMDVWKCLFVCGCETESAERERVMRCMHVVYLIVYLLLTE